jgi:hypothetical protein
VAQPILDDPRFCPAQHRSTIGVLATDRWAASYAEWQGDRGDLHLAGIGVHGLLHRSAGMAFLDIDGAGDSYHLHEIDKGLDLEPFDSGRPQAFCPNKSCFLRITHEDGTLTLVAPGRDPVELRVVGPSADRFQRVLHELELILRVAHMNVGLEMSELGCFTLDADPCRFAMCYRERAYCGGSAEVVECACARVNSSHRSPDRRMYVSDDGVRLDLSRVACPNGGTAAAKSQEAFERATTTGRRARDASPQGTPEPDEAANKNQAPRQEPRKE